MDTNYIDMQIKNIKQGMKATEYQLNYLQIQYNFLQSQLKYLESIRPNEKSNEDIPLNMRFTLEEIQQNYNGEDGKPAYVVVDNTVYDVSNLDSWGGGTHYGLYAGEDLTEYFNSCHNGKVEMLKRVAPIVGYIL